VCRSSDHAFNIKGTRTFTIESNLQYGQVAGDAGIEEFVMGLDYPKASVRGFFLVPFSGSAAVD